MTHPGHRRSYLHVWPYALMMRNPIPCSDNDRFMTYERYNLIYPRLIRGSLASVHSFRISGQYPQYLTTPGQGGSPFSSYSEPSSDDSGTFWYGLSSFYGTQLPTGWKPDIHPLPKRRRRGTETQRETWRVYYGSMVHDAGFTTGVSLAGTHP